MIERLAHWSFHHRWRVLAAWLVVVVGVTALAGSLGPDFATSGRLKGTDSDAAYKLLGAEFPQAGGDTATIVFHDMNGLDVGDASITAYLEQAAGLPGVAGVLPPARAPDQVSADGTVAFATIEVAAGQSTLFLDEAVPRLEALAAPVQTAGTDVAFGGDWFTEGGVPATEALGLLAAAVILVLAFGSIVAMGLPIVTALVGLAAAGTAVTLWSNVLPTPEFTVQVAAMIGLGVGIDYALFLITRYRTALLTSPPSAAMAEAAGTAGRAIAFAGGVVVISLLGMLLMGLDVLNGLALSTSTAVAIAVVAALTLLPALMSFATGRLAHSARRHAPAAGRETRWHRWGRLVQRHPWGMALGATALLLALAAPALTMRLASADSGNDPAGSTTRQAYDLLAAGFGPGANGPLLVAVDLTRGGAPSTLESVREAVAATPGVAFVTEPVVSASGGAAVLTAYPTTSPQARATEQLVHRLRSDVLPAAIAGTPVVVHVGGATASNVDFAQKMSDRLPVFIGAVLLLSFLLLAMVFRSVLVPLKAVVMNLLSIGAAYGVMVAVFQHGWFGGLFGVAEGAPIEPWAPMMLFAIVFGLSMDYEVFLLSSMKERYDATRDNSHAVVEGLAATARVITAAAAIMVVVFGGFVFGELRAVKLIGLGLASAVLIDATVVRMVLVPATMELLGDRNWWLPRWMHRVMPRLQVERTNPWPLPVEVG